MTERIKEYGEAPPMERVVYGRGVEVRYPDDVGKIREALNRRNLDASDLDIQSAYEDYSEDYWAAGWISPPSSVEGMDQIVDHLLTAGYLRKVG